MAKFTIQQVLEGIKQKFTNAEGKSSLQLSDRTITETLEPFFGLVGEELEVDEFIDKYGYKAIDSSNRNLIKMNSDFVKNYKPTKHVDHDDHDHDDNDDLNPITMDKIKVAISEAIKPFQEKIEIYESEKNTKNRRDEIVSLRDQNFKLSKAWCVDFDNSIEFAEMLLGKDASAKDVYDKAVEKFNKTLSERNETYKPVEGGGGDEKPNFDAIIAKRKAAKDAADGKQ